MTPRIGVAITTKDRRDVFLRAIEHHRKFAPPDVRFVIVDDASATPALPAVSHLVDARSWVGLRNQYAVGWGAAKNQCLATLLDLGCDQLFLYDDDAWPICENWWRPYVDHPEPHLTACFEHGSRALGDILPIYRDGTTVAYSRPRGHMLYFDRRVIDRVGGMDPRFRHGQQHREHSQRVHNAGLTSWAFQDVPNSQNLVLSLDAQEIDHPSTYRLSERLEHFAHDESLARSLATSDRFVEYRGTHDVVLTCLFTTQIDPQRDAFMSNDAALATTLLASLTAHGIRGVLLHDAPLDNEELVRFPHQLVSTKTASLNAYIQRWVSYRQWLVAHPEVRSVWCVDATDVELLRDPTHGLEHGTLYCGWENQVVGCPWMIKHHAASRSWLQAHGDEMLLNPGVVGGDRTVMMELCARIVGHWADGLSRGLQDQRGDMAYFNRAVADMREADIPVLTGPRVTTLYKGDQRSVESLWKHK